MTIQGILDLWIEKGAVYKWLTINEWYIDEGQESSGIYTLSLGLDVDDKWTFNDILYWDSNFWEVMFPWHCDWKKGGMFINSYWLTFWFEWFKTYTEHPNEDIYDSCWCAYFGKYCYYYKMQSVLHKDKIKYISNSLTTHSATSTR